MAILADRVVVNGLPVQFLSVEQIKIDGGQGDDTYRVSGLGAKVTISDGGGIDLLDFSRAMAGVTMNLASTYGTAQKVFANNAYTLGLKNTLENVIATPYGDLIKGNSAANRIWGGAGNDTIYGSSGDDWLYGEDGNDVLYGDSGNDVLLGGAGNDQLNAGSGKNLLIGGLGLDTLAGSYSEELLIGGTTSWDANALALAAIMSEWRSTRTFKQRCDNLEIAGVLAADGTRVFLRRTVEVQDDATRDVLFGSSGSDWFLGFLGDDVRDRGTKDR